jgi:arsenate reductase
MKRVLVLCTGNSSRSQMAEGYLKFYAEGKFEVYSAGLEDHGINPLTIFSMNDDNIDVSVQFSKSIHNFHGEHFDYLISVCEASREDVARYVSFDKFIHYDIIDPAGVEGTTSEKESIFLQVREEIKRCVLKFLGKELYEKV